MSRQTVQLIPTNLDIRQRARHTKLANDGVEDIAQVCALGIDIPGFEDLRDDGVVDEEFSDVCLSLPVCVVRCVEFANSWEEDAACFAVADAQWAELELSY